MTTTTTTAAPVATLKKLAQFQTPDGKIFDTQREATQHLRSYLVDAALLAVANNDQQLADWLKENRTAIEKAYAAADVERAPVSEETKAKMKAVRDMTPEQRKAHNEARDAKEAAEKAQRKAAKEALAKATYDALAAQTKTA
jgi:predicted  nucleic acid-binding Zn-ribbon protein